MHPLLYKVPLCSADLYTLLNAEYSTKLLPVRLQNAHVVFLCGAWALRRTNGCRDFCSREGEASWRCRWNKEWHESMKRRVKSRLELSVPLRGRKNNRRRKRWGSTESVTQLSAGFNWINLLWNVQVLPGLMPCAHWRLGRRVSGGLARSVRRPCHETGSEKANFPHRVWALHSKPPLSPPHYSVWTYSTTHASYIKTQDTLASPIGHGMYTEANLVDVIYTVLLCT